MTTVCSLAWVPRAAAVTRRGRAARDWAAITAALIGFATVIAYLAIIIIGREITVSALREWMAQICRSNKVSVAFIGKVKTVAQMTALIALLLWEPVIPGISTRVLGTIALWVAAILTLWSMFHYLRLAAPHFESAGSTREPDGQPARWHAAAPGLRDVGVPLRLR